MTLRWLQDRFARRPLTDHLVRTKWPTMFNPSTYVGMARLAVIAAKVITGSRCTAARYDGSVCGTRIDRVDARIAAEIVARGRRGRHRVDQCGGRRRKQQRAGHLQRRRTEEHRRRLGEVVHRVVAAQPDRGEIDCAIAQVRQQHADADRGGGRGHHAGAQRRDHYRPAMGPPLPRQHGRDRGNDVEHPEHQERRDEEVIGLRRPGSREPALRRGSAPPRPGSAGPATPTGRRRAHPPAPDRRRP